MKDAVIVSTARTPIGKAYRGAFNNTQGQELAGHAIAEAVKRAGVAPAEIEDVIVGCALQQGSTGGNVARQALLRAGLPVSVPGQSMDRQCSSGLMAIATAAKQIITDGMQVAIGGGSTQSAALNANTAFVRVHTDAICHVAFGTNPTSSSSQKRLAANSTEFFGVPAGKAFRVAVISGS